MPLSRVKSRVAPLALALATISWLGACTDTVFRDRAPFNPPPDAASGFLGYFTTSTQQTTCGNCHVDHQTKWATHKHSQAYADLIGSGHSSPTCFGCHTVSELGNAVDTAAGWNKVQNAAYQDVQCESCHGPGTIHVTTPDANTSPLAKIDADTVFSDTTLRNVREVGSCAECHNDTHHPFVEQWRQSRHGQANSHAAANPSCVSCHEGRGILRAWGVTANYKERNDIVTTDSTTMIGVTCAVCHDPHGSTNPASLRYPLNTPSLETNLCMKCHSRRFELDTANGTPHGPQGPVLLGTAGWWPAGMDTFPQATTHGNPAANPTLCAGCHVKAFTVTDSITGGFVFQSVGHLFRPIPCIDQVTGLPLPGSANTCAYDATSRNWSSCVSSGCHSDAGVAAAALNASRANLKILADLLWIDTDSNKVLDATDGGYLATIKLNLPAEFTKNSIITAAEGASFNVQIFGEHLTNHPDNSFGVHNPFLAQRLLAVSITAMLAAYPTFLPAPPPAVQRLMNEAMAKAKAMGPAVSLGTH